MTATAPTPGDGLLPAASAGGVNVIRPLVQAACALIGAVAVVVLIGWALDVRTLKSVLPHAVEMKANTAIALLFATGCLFLRSAPRSSRNVCASCLLALIVGAIGVVTLLEYALNWQAGIDQLLFVDHTDAYNPIRGRMSPYSAVAFACFGFALGPPPRPAMRPILILGALAVSTVGLTSLLGYAWNANELTTDQWAPPVALNTAAAFALLGLCSIVADAGATGRGSAAEIAMRGRLEVKVLIGFLLALVLLSVGGGVTYRSQLSFEQAARLVVGSEEQRVAVDSVYTMLADAELAQRGYLLTSRADNRERYFVLAGEVRGRLADLRKQATGDRYRSSELERLQRLIDHRMNVLTEHVAIFERSGPDAVRASIANDDGLSDMREVRALIEQMDTEAAGLSVRRTAALSHARTRTLVAMIATLLLATLILLALFGSIARDMGKRARIAQALDQAQQEAQKATQAKSQFLAAMSHEIRTPMNGVLGILELLQQSSLLPAQLEMVNLARESADALLTIIDDVLDFSKIEAGRLEIERVPLSIAQVAEKTCGLLNRTAERNGTVLTVFCDPAIPERLIGDPNRVRQVLLNLTSNAIKFSSQVKRPGRVAVRATLAARKGDQAVVELTVTDNGIGMDTATLKRLFQPFSQADASTTRRYGGTGLGLAICQQLTGLMGGSIVAHSMPDEGATFTVRLPFAVEVDKGSTAKPEAQLERLPCLVIGGEQGIADDLASYLRHEGAAVVRQGDLDAAAQWAREQRAGLTVWVVEAGEGLPSVQELVAALRHQDPQTVKGVVVVLGRNVRTPRAAGEGIAIIDGNALSRDALVKTVAIAAGRAVRDPQPAPMQSPRTAPVSRESARREHRLILVAEDNAMNQHVIIEQLKLLGYAGEVAPNGREALERWRTGDYALILADLHMPEMDGYDLTLGVRAAEPAGRHIPIIALTANALEGEAERCRAVGMDDYLSKPASLASLGAVLERWLAPSCAPIPSSTGLASREPAVLDVRALEALVGSDPELIEQFLQEFRDSAERLAAEILGASDRPLEAAAAAHKLKSSARSVGATRLGDLCAAIETAGEASKLEALTDLIRRFEAEYHAVRDQLPLSTPRAADAQRA